MVQFTDYLASRLVPEWKEAYVDFGELKGMIYALSQGQAMADKDRRTTSLSAKTTGGYKVKFRGKELTESDFFAALETELGCFYDARRRGGGDADGSH